MRSRLIDKSALADLIKALGETNEVVVPTVRDDVLRFQPLETGEEPALDYRNSKLPPKEVFFPRSEVLFSYQDGQATDAPLDERDRAILGIRPCDARSFVMLDKVFNGPEFVDPYYAARREHTTLIGLGCQRPASTCFCTSVGGDPFSTDGLDLLLTDLGDRYLAEAITERGEELIGNDELFRDASAEDLQAKAEQAEQARTMTVPAIEGVKEKLDTMFDEECWSRLHEKCLGCGACTYLCPTCHCFDIVDEKSGNGGRRVRHWDSCQMALFTHHTSGHNPRPSGKERMRQRIMHKFDYFVENYGDEACVGCGRCVRDCPVNMDIRSVLDSFCES